MQYLVAALAEDLRTGIPEQPFSCSVPGKNFSLLIHTKSGICCPLKELK
jgi:hypothetical protein